MSKIREEIENQKETVENGLKKILCSVNDDSNNGVLVLRIAATLLDTDGKFVFLRANMDDGDLGTDAANEGKIERAAAEMQEQLTKDGASSITSYLIDAGVSCPFWLSYSGDTINTYVLTPNKEEVHISDEGRAVQVGFELNSKFLEACRSGCNVAIHLAFYPLNYTLSDSFFPAFALFVVESREDVARTFVEKTLPKVRECLAPIVILESMMRIEAANRHALKSAIGSIMSRNGSHNIGSHVLAALSHNVGTMPDDRVLYQYIQHRMNYMADATTDLPEWSVATPFVGSMMRTFLAQYHLLNHIAESEGLRAWEFQNRVKEPDDINSSGRIKIHVRRMAPGNDENNIWEDARVVCDFIQYPEVEIDLTKDVSLAIPGAVSGQHAFFNIIENIIRNAAKHNWAHRPARTEHRGNLDVYVDFIEDPSLVRFRISDNVSDVFDGIEDLAKDTSPLSYDRAKALSDKPLSLLPLHHQQQVRMVQPFVNAETGAVQKTNWGLAEMRISAGFLQKRSISEIGGIERPEMGKGDFIIGAVAVADEQEADLYHLGYEFAVEKPKEVLIVVDANTRKTYEDFIGQDWETRLTAAGIGVRQWGEGACDYEYVVFALSQYDDFLQGLRSAKYPFRIFSVSKDSIHRMIPNLDPASFVDAVKAGESLTGGIRVLLYRTWIGHLFKRCTKVNWDPDKKGFAFNLAIYPYHNDNGSGRGLVGNLDILRVVFGECFNGACDTFSTERVDVHNWISGDALKENQLRVLEELEARGECEGGSRDSGPIIERMQEVLEAAKFPEAEIDLFIEHLWTVYRNADVFLRNYEERINSLPTGYGARAGVQADMPRLTNGSVLPIGLRVETGGEARDPDDAVIDVSIRFQRHKIIKKDEALRGVYLEPLSGSQSSLKLLTNMGDGDYALMTKLVESGALRLAIVDERVANFLCKHPDLMPTYRAMRISVWGCECNHASTVAIENVWTKDGMVPVPEFFFDAVNKVVSVVEQFPAECAGVNIKIIVDQICIALQKSHTIIIEKYSTAFDALIVHQGMIDKWLPNMAHTAIHEEIFLAVLKRLIPYVVVTTGRGRPANIPDTARILPFSSIENALFKKYPEKMLITDTLMNILPVGQDN